jgi:hypothetical protein
VRLKEYFLIPALVFFSTALINELAIWLAVSIGVNPGLGWLSSLIENAMVYDNVIISLLGISTCYSLLNDTDRSMEESTNE